MIEKIIGSKVDEHSTVMIHGTSVEAALAILEKGRIEQESFTIGPHMPPSGYLYFVPNPGKFKQDPDVSKNSAEYEEAWQRCLNKEHFYSVRSGSQHHIVDKTKLYDDMILELPCFPYSKFKVRELAAFQKELFEDWIGRLGKQGFSRREVMSIVQESTKRRGVLLCMGESVLEHPYKHDEEDYAFKIHAPNGLDARHIISIIPQGEIERKLLLEKEKVTF